MSTINGRACVVNGTPVDKVFSNGRQVYSRNLLTSTSNVLTTVTNVTGWGPILPDYHPLEALKANQTYTASCYLEPAEHDAAIIMNYPNGNIFGTHIAAGSKGISKLTIIFKPEEVEAARRFWITFVRRQNDESAISYKGFKLEKGSLATPWSPAPEDVM